MRLVRKLGKAYFFQYFGEGRASSVPKAEKAFDRALQIQNDDAETIAYQGALLTQQSQRSKDPAERKAKGQQGLDLLKKALQLAPRNGAVLAITAGSFIALADDFGTAPLAAEIMEKIRAGMGPMFSKFSHHGQQRLLLTQGQAYAKMGQTDKARACFDEALKVDQDSVEARLVRDEIGKLR